MCKYKDDAPSEKCKAAGLETITRKIICQVNHQISVYPHFIWFTYLRKYISQHINKNTKWFKADKDLLVQKHNELRARVANGEETKGNQPNGQPKASNMKELVWNDELAAIAQRYCLWFLRFVGYIYFL